MSKHSLYEGSIIHRRYQPKSHQLKYSLFQLLLDLDELNDLAYISPF